MSKADICAAILWIGVTLYAIFGGADFGAGMWDLLAGRGGRGEQARRLIDRSIAPVWEANHVWLIFVLVVLWTAFPRVFSAVMTTLYIPLALAVLGIVLRGAGFAFRHALPGPVRGPATRVFGVSSLLTPFFLGTVVGAVASGRVPAAGHGDPTSSWTGMLPLLTGVLFVCVAAYMAAVFLVSDAGAAGDADLERYFTARALGIAVLAGGAALAGIFALHSEARYVYDRLSDQGLALVIVSGTCGLGALAMLARGTVRGLRPLAVGAVAAVIWGYFVAQFPYLLPTSLGISQGAASSGTLIAVIVIFGAAGLVCLPSLGLLYALSQKDVLG